MNQKAERIPLTGREYYALRALFGVISGFASSLGYLEKRAKGVKNLWRDLRLVQAVAEKSLDRVLLTVPADKLMHIHKDLKNIKISIDVQRETPTLPQKKEDTYCYVPEQSIDLLIQSTLEWQCFSCEKSKRECKRCDIKKALDKIVPYEVPENKVTDACKYSGLNYDMWKGKGA